MVEKNTKPYFLSKLEFFIIKNYCIKKLFFFVNFLFEETVNLCTLANKLLVWKKYRVLSHVYCHKPKFSSKLISSFEQRITKFFVGSI